MSYRELEGSRELCLHLCLCSLEVCMLVCVFTVKGEEVR